MLKTLFRVIYTEALKVCLGVILENIFNIFNI